MAKRSRGRDLAALAALGALASHRVVDLSPLPSYPLSDPNSEKDFSRRLARKPLVTDEEQAEMFKGIPGVRSETGVPVRSGAGLLQTQTRKKGGAVKGWGAARGARKAKVY